jgi:uncharacterized membrane protein
MDSLIPQDWLQRAVDLLVRLVEAGGAAIIFIGATLGFFRFVWVALRHRGQGSAAKVVGVRLDLGRVLALGLEFQLASDLLRTAIAPSFREIGQLAAVAAIRTALNFFLRREIPEEREELERGRGALA